MPHCLAGFYSYHLRAMPQQLRERAARLLAVALNKRVGGGSEYADQLTELALELLDAAQAKEQIIQRTQQQPQAEEQIAVSASVRDSN